VPNFFAITTESGSNVLVMQLLGKSLEDLFQERGKKLSIKTCLMAGLQMLDRVELLHKNGFLHRDMKPDNFLIGRGDEQSVIYVIDLGLSKRYIRDGVHAPYRTGKDLTGTARYVSIGTHQGYEQSRRDDLESLAYVILYLMRGSLPWQNLKPTDKKAKYQAILEKKLATPV
jgi:serine/threonine protein kinase